MKSVKYNKNLNKMLKTSIVTFSVLTIINCIRIVGSSNALFEKSIDSENNIKMKALDYWAKPEVATTSVTNLAKKDKINLAYDETVDNNLRYIGKDPNNYVSFNNELWRIIGVMNNIDDGTGKKESRIKLIKNENIYNEEFDINNSNDYSTSSTKTKLNEEYMNNLTKSSKNIVDNVVWNLGITDFGEAASKAYKKERSNTIYSNHNSTWIGKIGLIYSSDYLYATSGGTTTSKNSCLNFDEKYQWNYHSDCYKNDYLYAGKNTYFTLTGNSSSSASITCVHWPGSIYVFDASSIKTIGIRPSLYLKPSIKITGGYGTKNRPYTLG